jgi:Lar family restriction alleviation protein
METAADLKDCPFCGSGDIHLFTDDERWTEVFCNSCQSGTTKFYDEVDAIEMWNTREVEDEV